MNFTHKKRIYKATCVQWLGSNLTEITELLHQVGYSEVEVFRGAVMARSAGLPLLCIQEGWWLRVGEDGGWKVMSDSEFRLKYQPIEEGDAL